MCSFAFLCLPLSFATLIYAGAVPSKQQAKRQNGPVPPGTIKDCTFFYDSQPGDTCASISANWGITLQQFVTYNPSLKSDCSGLVIGDAYCVEENHGNGPAPVTTSISTTLTKSGTNTSSYTGPTPVQTGINAQCKQYYKVQDGDTCAGIVDKYHTFTLKDFYSWNPAIGSNCEALLLGDYICVGIPGNPTAPPTTTSAGATNGPSPTQSGLVPNCKSFYKVQDGDECGKIVSSYGTFSLADFYTWNPAIGTDCGSLISGYYICVSVPGTPTTRSSATSTATSETHTSPSPTQSGIISSCTRYYKAVSGDGCQGISDKFGTFSLSQFVSWNPAVKSDCSGLFLDFYYCIAIPGTPSSPTTKSTSETPAPVPKGPQPQQPGIVGNCNKYYLVKGGDSCFDIEHAQKVSAADFQKWNSGIKSDCSNLFVSYYLCIGVS